MKVPPKNVEQDRVRTRTVLRNLKSIPGMFQHRIVVADRDKKRTKCSEIDASMEKI